MLFMDHKSKAMLKLINKFSCIEISQLERLTKYKKQKFDKYLYSLSRQGLIKIFDTVILSPVQRKVDRKMIMAIEVLCYFADTDKITRNENEELVVFRGAYPFKLSFMLQNQILDIAAVEANEENLFSASMTRSSIPKVIIVADSMKTIDNLNINNKEIRYCTLNPLLFYTK